MESFWQQCNAYLGMEKSFLNQLGRREAEFRRFSPFWPFEGHGRPGRCAGHPLCWVVRFALFARVWGPYDISNTETVVVFRLPASVTDEAVLHKYSKFGEVRDCDRGPMTADMGPSNHGTCGRLKKQDD
jgi:hypothetical protein